MSLSQYANPFKGIMVELELGQRGKVQTTVPDGDECDHIALLLRRGVTNGIGLLQWELRTAPGVRFPQEQLDEIAATVEEGCLTGTDPCWRIIVRR
ncbi:MAG: hypothetical protein EON55_16115 [Alphaproteobacteria bacterium]|nr:MAG: hypothetical protein EON55_16115 [Alphaproteobacteria bacterium]